MPTPRNLRSLNETVIACRLCPRLVAWRERVAREKRKAYLDWEYWGKPVPGFGDPRASIVVVGLAPGAHGSNRTGRQFTGDASGKFLYPALYRAGFASRPESVARDDGLELRGLYITAAARCAPPGNKPMPDELDNCQLYLERELALLRPRVIVALGRIAFERVLRIYRLRGSGFRFAHGALYRLVGDPLEAAEPAHGNGPWLLASYHPSQQNTLTGKLTGAMFDMIWLRARQLAQE